MKQLVLYLNRKNGNTCTHNQRKQGHVYQNLRVIILMVEKHDFSVC